MAPEASTGNQGVGDGPLSTLWHRQLDRLEQGGRLTRNDVREAMEEHPRWRFLGPSASSKEEQAAIKDNPVPLVEGQTISAPHMVAILLETAQPEPGDACLEIGAGSGWLAALLAHIVEPGGHVTGLEIHAKLANMAQANTQAIDNTTIIHGDGSLGHPPNAPYDVIIVSCGAPEIPDPLIEQLAQGGRLVIPVGPRGHQRLHRITKTPQGPKEEDLGPCAFVPLTGEHGH